MTKNRFAYCQTINELNEAKEAELTDLRETLESGSDDYYAAENGVENDYYERWDTLLAS